MAADFANALTQRHNSLNGTTLQECYSCTDSGVYIVECIETISPYDCTGYSLPTEAEWEYAARSGTTEDFWTPAGGGNPNLPGCDGTETIEDGSANPPLVADYAWYCANTSQTTTREVGLKLPNDFDLYDMHGNVYEWTADWWGKTAR